MKTKDEMVRALKVFDTVVNRMVANGQTSQNPNLAACIAARGALAWAAEFCEDVDSGYSARFSQLIDETELMLKKIEAARWN